MRVSAVIVTYNRKNTLQKCIEAVCSQTRNPDTVYIIDNHSTDGTGELLTEKGIVDNPCGSGVYKKCKTVHRYLPDNLGGAGGFSRGMREAYDNGADAVWIMDDDVIPDIHCLEELLRGKDSVSGPVSFLASAVRGADGEAMNVPKIDKRQFYQYTDWYQYLEYGVVRIAKATFVSILVLRDAIASCGFPWEPFFIWGDDSEYTQRLIRDYGPAYMIGTSKAVHLRGTNEELSIVRENNRDRIPLYYYYYRNNLIGFWEYESHQYRILWLAKMCMDYIGIITRGKYKIRKMYVVNRALAAFIFKRYDRVSFNKRSEFF